ncbi:MAG TPA: penicillin-binding protein 2, partial [Myxococcota bacterium]|nr:penicillin-binding protein 2 [Myxococcota bacterium]
IATDKRWAAVTVQGPRGEVLDADGNVLAKSVRTPAVFVDPTTMAERGVDLDEAAVAIADVLDLPIEPIRKALSSQGRYVRLARGVHPAVADELRALGLTNKGLIIEENYHRYYPQGALAGQVLGYVGDSDSGVQGVESAFDDVLRGAELVTQHRVNSTGRVLELENRDDRSIHGMTVHTTIDRELQRATERALAGVIERSAPVWAAAVVVEVKTGRVLAMATAPSFDPNDPGSQDFAVMRNRVVSDPVEPGSVFKVFTYSAALEEHVTRPDEIIATPSPFPIAGAMIRDDHPHGHMTAAEIVKYSSNVGSAQLAQRLGQKRLLSYLESFGFGDVTGVQTSHEERGRRSPPRVGPVELATISYGQGVTATLMQLVMGTATIANGGVRMRPILVDRVEDAYGLVRQAWEPVAEARVISPETAHLVAEAMEHVTDSDATAPRARIPGYRVAGKTGTAYKVKDGRYSQTARYAGFIGFAPADRPELAMAILIDEPTIGSRYGGVVAAPLFSEVIGPELHRRGVPVDPTLPGAPMAGDPAEIAVVEREPLVLSWVGAADGGWRMPDLGGRDL